MNDNTNRVYDLEERTFLPGRKVRLSLKKINIHLLNEDDIRQLIRSSGSVGANYIEANESLSKKDFFHRIKICRKESKETAYCIRMIIETDGDGIKDDLKTLHQEAIEFWDLNIGILKYKL